MHPKLYCQHQNKNHPLCQQPWQWGEQSRRAIAAVTAYASAVEQALHKTSSPTVAHPIYQWWQQQLTNAYQHTAQHPIGLALAPAIQRFQLDQQHFNQLLSAYHMDCDIRHFPSQREVDLYHQRKYGGLLALYQQILSPTVLPDDTKSARQSLALGLGYSQSIQQLGKHLRAGRIYFAQSQLEQHQLEREKLLALQHTEGLITLLQHNCQQADCQLSRAIAELKAYRSLRPLQVVAVQTKQLLTLIDNAGYPVISQLIQPTGWQNIRSWLNVFLSR